jgi:1-acyl-sn-glycerol-3-phosphate acyltransferase
LIKFINQLLRGIFFICIVRPVIWVVLGLNIRHRERLPKKGPAIIIANHNSHLDTMTLMSLFPLKLLSKLRPLAAADYFLSNKFMSWFSLNIIRIIPISRKREEGVDPFESTYTALNHGDIIILYPEGTRGEPEKMQSFKSGIAYLAQNAREVPVIPIFLYGLGKALPKGESILVPFFCDVFIGEALYWTGSKESYMKQLDEAMHALASEHQCTTDY